MKSAIEPIRDQVKRDLSTEREASLRLYRDALAKFESLNKFGDMIIRAIDEACNKSSQGASTEEKFRSLEGHLQNVKFGILNEIKETQRAVSYLKGRVEATDRSTEIVTQILAVAITESEKVELLAQKIESGEFDPDAKVPKKTPDGMTHKPERIKAVRNAQKLATEKKKEKNSKETSQDRE